MSPELINKEVDALKASIIQTYKHLKASIRLDKGYTYPTSQYIKPRLDKMDIAELRDASDQLLQLESIIEGYKEAVKDITRYDIVNFRPE
jgi:hypothetical protein